MKPKKQYAENTSVSSSYDRCQTPPYGVEPLLRYINPSWKVWEPAAGDGIIAAYLRKNGFSVVATDLLQGKNFFAYVEPDVNVIITNPPYSAKYTWLIQCCEVELPFALLVPIEMLGAATTQKLFKKHNIKPELLLTEQRIDFKMPNAGWQKSNAQFPTMWLTSGFNMGQQLTFVTINKPKGKEKLLLESEVASLLKEYGNGPAIT